MKHFEIENGILKKYTGPGGVVTVPDGVKTLGIAVFYDNQTLTAVLLPDGLVEIGQNAFNGSEELIIVRLPDSLRIIRDDAFQLCPRLSLCSDFTSEMLSDGRMALEGILELPKGFSLLEESAFCGCYSLKRVTIPGSVREIPRSVFFDSISLESVLIKSGVTKINASAFACCPKLTDVHIPESVIDIDNDAFFTRPPGLTISGISGSFAERWAKLHEIPFKQSEVMP